MLYRRRYRKYRETVVAPIVLRFGEERILLSDRITRPYSGISRITEIATNISVSVILRYSIPISSLYLTHFIFLNHPFHDLRSLIIFSYKHYNVDINLTMILINDL